VLPSPAVRATLFGAFAITAGDRTAGPWPRPSARRLCELLLVSPGHKISRDLACAELFPRLAPHPAARSLSKALSMARAALAELGEPGAALLGGDLTHVWLSSQLTVDADVQTTALHAALAMASGHGRDDALQAALADDGELLPDELYADWADRARDQLNSLRQEVRLALARGRAQGAGRSAPDDVTAAWLACLDHDAACEEAASALIRGFLAQDRPERAARVFERCQAALEQLGLRVSPSLERIYTSAIAVRTAMPLVPQAFRTSQTSSASSVSPVLPASLAASVSPASQVSPASLSPAFPAVVPPGPERVTAPPDAASLTREERRPVTVLFAEVAAPGGRAGPLDLETLLDLVSGSLASVITEVEALGGTVGAVSGRGLQAMFGAPQAHEDDPERALRAAYRALAAVAVASFTPSLGPDHTNTPSPVVNRVDAVGAVPAGPGADGTPGLRIGIESGPALVGPIGSGAKVEYAALGDVVNAAAALQSAARPGSVLVGPATRAATAHLFTWGALEAVAPTPGAGPLAAAYLGEPRATAAERRPRLGGRAPLAGRQAELRLLDNAMRGAVAGRGQVIVLAGEPGIGKTRLVQESRKRFIAWVGAGSGQRPLWLEGRGASYASATPYGLYRQLIAGWIGVAPDQPADRLRGALADALTRLMGNTNLLAPLDHLMGLPSPDATQAAAPNAGQAHKKLGPLEKQRQAFAAVRTLVTRFTAMAPTVLVLEDLHWADPTSLRLTAELAELAASRPLLLLATTRLQAGDEFAAAAGAVHPATRQIQLRPLRQPAAEALATSLLGQVAGPEVLATVLASADGNPLFLEERLAELIETGVLIREQGAWRLREPARLPVALVPASPAPRGASFPVAVPQTLERLVRSRVDRLSPAGAEAIRAASVLGTEFSPEILATMLATEPPALTPVLDELCASDLVHPGPRDSAKPFFRFRHALIQEATYLALLRRERRQLHGRAAMALAEAYATQLAEVATVLGRHYAIADDPDRAVRYLELGGDRATDAFANDEAIAAFREALAVTSRLASGASSEMVAAAVRLQAKLANVLWRTARRPEAREAFQAALRLANAGPSPLDRVLRAHLYTRLARLELTEPRYEEAVAAFDAAEALLALDARQAAEADDAAVEEWLELMVDGRAELHVMRFEPDRALAVLDQAQPVLEARGSPARRMSYYRLRTLQKLLRNGLRVDEEDIARLRVSVAAVEQDGEDKDVGYAADSLGWALWLRGDLPAATRELTRALRLAERIGETHLRDLALLTLSLTALRSHDVEAVRTLLPRTHAAAEQAGGYIGSRITVGWGCAAWLAWQDGRPDEVIRLAAEIQESGRPALGSAAVHRWVYLFPLLAAHLKGGDTGKAVAAARQVIAPSQQWLPDDLTAAITRACDSWDQDDPEQAAEHLTAVLALARTHSYF
jgi:class 3 adenylate cyclase/DNA-binding SARP family transcriptional activator/tetratricopeptide (TPR) repeat protein